MSSTHAPDHCISASRSSVACTESRGYVRHTGLSANQLLHVPLAGDFQMSHMCSCAAPAVFGRQPALKRKLGLAPDAMGITAEEEARVLATADHDQREPLTRENVPDTLAGEQTWPTEEVRVSRTTLCHACVFCSQEYCPC